ncbi:MAG TPA: AI-2E family transporter [Candidatus Pacearchaeota archaeon]|nr:AI-2E family transporter [Candidatus Pacearchaeota archaeon]HOK94400.1 AI-2E family transporter [Candidatus Pacearchaeota archaeon]HPO75473.1 AI-2E family transporter [Candidatus Pacearchaeota archaeon]
MSSTLTTALKIIGVIIGILVLYFIRDVVGYVLLAFVFASALKPGVDLLEKKKIPRALSAILIFLLFLVFFSCISYLVFPPLINEIQNFISSFPQYWQNFLDWLPQFEEWTTQVPFGKNIESTISQSIQGLSKAIGSAFGAIYNFFGKTFDLFFVLITAFYLVVEKNIAEKFVNFFFKENEKAQKKILRYWQLAEKQAGRWLQGYIFLGIIVGMLVYAGLYILGVKYSLVLAVLAGTLEIIPFFGPVFAGIFGLFLAFFQGGWILALWTVFVFFIIQQLENYLIVPLIMKDRVDLNPLLTILVLFIGGRIGGFLGMILSVPLMAIFIALWKEKKNIDSRPSI